jgi:hypothetical protein
MAGTTRELTALVTNVGLAGFVLLVVLVASTGAMFKPGGWYEALVKPVWTPPNWLFPVAWTLLYLMIALAGWQVWRAGVACSGIQRRRPCLPVLLHPACAQRRLVLVVFRIAPCGSGADRCDCTMAHRSGEHICLLRYTPGGGVLVNTLFVVADLCRGA